MSDYKVIINNEVSNVNVIESGYSVTVSTAGVTGEGVPSGGATGWLLAKNSGTDFDTEWIDPTTVGVTDHGNLTGLADDDHTQYLNSARFDTAFAAKSTTDLAEGTNLYYTSARFDSAFSGKTTDNLTEGSTNLYFTSGRAISAVASTYVAKAGDTMTGELAIQTATNSTTAFNVLNSSGSSVFNVDTTNKYVGIGTTTIAENLSITGYDSGATGTIATGIRLTPNPSVTTYYMWLRAYYKNANVLQIGKSATTFATFDNSGNLGLGTTTPSAKLHIEGFAAATIGQIIRGALSQTANLTEWQDSAGTVVAKLSVGGRFATNTTFGGLDNSINTSNYYLLGSRFIFTQGGMPVLSAALTTSTGSAIQYITTGAAISGTSNMSHFTSSVSPAAGSGVFNALYIDATTAATGAQSGSHTALKVNRTNTRTAFTTDILADFQAGGASRFKVVSDGEVDFYNSTGRYFQATSTGVITLGDGSSSYCVINGATAQFFITTSSASKQVAIFRGAVSQTANLTEWQNSAGAILVRVNSLGDLITSSAFYTHLGLVNTSSGNNSYIGVPATGPYITRNIADSSPALYIRNVNASSTGNILECRGSSNTNLFSVTVAGKMNIDTSNTATTATAGALTLPANPEGFIIIQVGGVDKKIPYYAN